MDVFGFHDPGHGDEHVQLGESGEDLGCGGGDRVRVGGVDDDGLDTGVVGGDLLEQFGTPPADDHLVAGGLKPVREAQADAGSAAGDEDGVVVDVHAVAFGLVVVIRRASVAAQRRWAVSVSRPAEAALPRAGWPFMLPRPRGPM